MYIEEIPVRHVTDDAKNFSVAKFVEPPTSKSVWDIILTVWETAYMEFPKAFVFDEGSQFRYTFVEICEILYVERKRSGTQHNSTLEKQ